MHTGSSINNQYLPVDLHIIKKKYFDIKITLKGLCCKIYKSTLFIPDLNIIYSHVLYSNIICLYISDSNIVYSYIPDSNMMFT